MCRRSVERRSIPRPCVKSSRARLALDDFTHGLGIERLSTLRRHIYSFDRKSLRLQHIHRSAFAAVKRSPLTPKANLYAFACAPHLTEANSPFRTRSMIEEAPEHP